MLRLGDTVHYIRSKNAGPFWLTIDLFCDNEDSFRCLSESKSLSAENIAKIYRVKSESVKIFSLPSLKVIKISLPRVTTQGSPADADMHGGQQYIPLLDIEL